MQGLRWEEYLHARLGPERISDCRMACGPALLDQREQLGELFRLYRPNRIACLGSGILNDIPIGDFILGGSEVFLVDWIGGVSETGFASSLIQRDGGKTSCLVCDQRCTPGNFCAAFRGPVHLPDEVCDNFRLIEKPYLHCASYSPSVEPHFLTDDITQGRASAFAKRAEKSPEQAFVRMIGECRRCEIAKVEIGLESDSVDLVTSSMVVSQFDAEPYGFFSRLLERRFDPREIMRREEKIQPLMKRLRGELFRIQIEGHAQELHRIVKKKGGRVYFSVELFRSLPQGADYFLVHEITRALEVLGGFFHFDFSTVPPERALRSLPMGEGNSIVQCYLLTPIGD